MCARIFGNERSDEQILRNSLIKIYRSPAVAGRVYLYRLRISRAPYPVRQKRQRVCLLLFRYLSANLEDMNRYAFSFGNLR